MHRHGLTDDQWRRLQAVLPRQKAGPPATRGDRLLIEACCTGPRQAWLGAISRSGLAHGSPSTTASPIGHARATGPRSLESCSSRSTRPGPSSTAPLSALIKMRRAEKGGRTKCSGPLSSRFFNQTPRRRRHQRPPAPHRAHAGAARNDRGRRAPCLRAGQGAHRRHRLRLEPLSASHTLARDEARHQLDAEAAAKASEKPQAVRQALPGRDLLPQPQTLPGYRDSYEKAARNYLALVPLACARLWLEETRDSP